MQVILFGCCKETCTEYDSSVRKRMFKRNRTLFIEFWNTFYIKWNELQKYFYEHMRLLHGSKTKMKR